ncbi:TniQ family protein [Pseudomonas sp. Pseu.R1]|uniref:TniQ family protein n=1 Tax=Pseudomonas sp. Pseu.R1 TaxID=3379818 RepID=UPI003B93B644
MDDMIFLPYPLEEESPSSILKRFALGHGCECPAQLQDFTFMINLNKSEMTICSPLVQWIAARAGRDAQRFLAGFYIPLVREGKHGPFEINGTIVPSKFIRRGPVAFCSQCWDERHERYIKDISLTECCPYHHRRYIHECPACHHKLYWISALNGRCACGHVFVSEACSDDDVYSERYLLETIRNQDSSALSKLKMLLLELGYCYNRGGDSEERKVVLNAAAGIMRGQRQYIDEYLHYQTKKYPHIPLSYIQAKLRHINEPVIKTSLEQFRMDHTPAPSLPAPSFVDPPEFELSRAQLVRISRHSMKELKNCQRTLDFHGQGTVYARYLIDILCHY